MSRRVVSGAAISLLVSASRTRNGAGSPPPLGHSIRVEIMNRVRAPIHGGNDSAPGSPDKMLVLLTMVTGSYFRVGQPCSYAKVTNASIVRAVIRPGAEGARTVSASQSSGDAVAESATA